MSLPIHQERGVELERIPTTPGVYLYKDAHGRILYVGKAKRLRSRVASYFRAHGLTPKTRAMLGLAVSLDFLVTATEKEALLLEASLIKKHRPRYNIVLRDDKQYVLFKLDKRTDYPRLFLTRNVTKDGSLYFGPFTSAQAARDAWKAIHAVFPLRRCKDTIFRNRLRPCLYHDMGLCLGPCCNPVDIQEYATMVARVEMLLGGRSSELVKTLDQDMRAASDALDFERAAELRDQIRAVRRTLEQQAAVLPKAQDMDVVGLAGMEEGLGLGLLFIRQGRLLDKKHFFFHGLDLDDGPEVLEHFLTQFYEPGRFVPPTLLLPWDPAFLRSAAEVADTEDTASDETDHEQEDAQETALAEALAERREGPVRLVGPRNSVEKKLVALARANAREAALSARRPPLLPAVAQALKLPNEPWRIEAVDVSHHKGQETRVGMVVYEGGRPRQEDYRVYNFDDGVGDDYAVLAAWTARRLESGPPWPDLLLVDGGKGQLNAVTRALREAGEAALFPVASIAKARDVEPAGHARRRTHALEDVIYLPGRKNPASLAPGSQELLFLQQVRDAVHKFAIGRHRRSRRKSLLESELLQLEGVGPKTAKQLWDAFGSVAAMADASLEDLRNVPGLGAKKAAAIHTQLQALKSA